MNDLLLIRSINDGYNIKLCANFGHEQTKVNKGECDEEANERHVSLFFTK